VSPEVVRHDDAGAVAADVATRLLEALAATQTDGRVPQIGLTGGSIADLVHREVARLSPDSGVDWSQVVVWWGDERFVGPDDPDRNARQARAAFLDAVGADPANVHEMPSTADASTPAEGAAAYGEEMRAYGAGEFDVLMLGVGPDGHVASLFPGHASLDVDDQIALGVTDSPKPPPDRISLSFSCLNRSRAVWFLVSGDEKAEAVRRGLAGAGDVHETPARGVSGRESTVWFLDDAAASLL
jgi:6-phosphogluconolactonase